MKAEDFLHQWVNYGGEWVTIGWLFKAVGDAPAGAWLAGYVRGGGEVRREH